MTGPAIFVPGRLFEHTFETNAGEVGFRAEVEMSGSILVLRDVAVYPAGTAGSLNVGTGQVMQALHQLENLARSQGFSELQITGTRLSGVIPEVWSTSRESEMSAAFKTAEETVIASDAKRLINSGANHEIVLGFLRERGFNKLDSIKALVNATGMSLNNAKGIVHHGRAWQDTFSRDEEFHASLLKAVQALDLDGQSR
jgi:ribosomal protein L7/L12